MKKYLAWVYFYFLGKTDLKVGVRESRLKAALQESRLKTALRDAALLGTFLVYAYFCYKMWLITAQYIPYNPDTAFLRIKQDEVQLPYYLTAFYVHAYTAILSLLAGFTQFSPYIQKKYPKVHRRAGWLYIVVVLAFAAPSGFMIGIHANGGWSSQLAFCLLAILWFGFTAMALFKIKKHDIQGHRAFMYRSFALALSAITLRCWKYVLVAMFHPHPMDVYRVIAWLGWVLNWLLVEIFILKTSGLKTKYPYRPSS